MRRKVSVDENALGGGDARIVFLDAHVEGGDAGEHHEAQGRVHLRVDVVLRNVQVQQVVVQKVPDAAEGGDGGEEAGEVEQEHQAQFEPVVHL